MSQREVVGQRIPTLSIRQPWAWAILHAGKTIENREWPRCSYRGPIFIHASLWPAGFVVDKQSRPGAIREAEDEGYAMLAMARKARRRFSDPVTLRTLYEHRGGIVGRARIVAEVRQAPDLQWMKMTEPGIYFSLTNTDRAWWVGGFGLVLADVEPIELVECKGALGLFQVDDVVRERVLRAKAVPRG